MFLHNTNKLANCLSQAHCHITYYPRLCRLMHLENYSTLLLYRNFSSVKQDYQYTKHSLAGHFCFIFSANAIFAIAEILEHY